MKRSVFSELYLRSYLSLYGTEKGWLMWLYNKWYGPLTDRIYGYIVDHAQEGDPGSIIKMMDRFARKQQRAFFIGDKKGPVMQTIVKETQPKVSLELGSFVGYSAITAAQVLPKGARYYCVEPDVQRVVTLRKVVRFAGLDDKIRIIQGFSNKVIPTLKKDLCIDAFDYVFIDHEKSMYKSDLLLMEEHGLIKPGTVIVADNVITPGSPDYLEYIRNSPKYCSEFFAATLEYCSQFPDGVEKSTYIG